MTNEVKPDGRIYWATGVYDVNLLIPKKRGHGFLRTPIGHHRNNLSDFISNLGYDCFGLDGYVTIKTSFHDKIDQEYQSVIKKVAEFLGVEYVRVSHDSLMDYVIKH